MTTIETTVNALELSMIARESCAYLNDLADEAADKVGECDFEEVEKGLKLVEALRRAVDALHEGLGVFQPVDRDTFETGMKVFAG